jgi:hypothetical protein
MTGSAMAGGVEISGELREWASLADFSLTPTDRNGRAVFWSNNGEIRYFIGRGTDGWLRVTCSNRTGPEQLELAAPSLPTIETYFYGFFGSDVRYGRHFPQATPVERLPDGFEVGSLANKGRDDFERFDSANQDYLARFDDTNRNYRARSDEANQYYLALFDNTRTADDGTPGVTAVDGFGEVLARIRLSDLAVYLSHSTDEITASFMARDGAPLLAVTEGEGAPA